MNINNFFDNLAANASRNYKIDQLKAYSNNQILKRVIKLALDPFTQFYIRKIPNYTPNLNDGISLNFALDSLNDLSMRNVTGNAGIEHLRGILEALNIEDAKVIERIIQKDLKCGVSIATANAVWKDLLKEYPVMLCSQFDQKLVDKIKYPALVQLKMDGMRFNAIVQNGKVEYRSRNGKEIQLLGNLDSDFIKLSNGVNCVFDGELLVANPDGSLCDRQTGNGILNKANKGTITSKESAMVRATVWDIIPYNDFVVGKCNVAYGQRWESLCVLMDTYMPERVRIVDSWEISDYATAQSLFEEFIQRGEEGIILKDKSGVWEDKRAKHQIKFKGELECDLKIVGVEEGTGKYAGMLGAIICQSSDGGVTVNVGSGFTDSHRKNLWKETLIDKIVAVKYNMRIKNRAGEESLFLPVFVEIREDKNVADSSAQIQ